MGMQSTTVENSAFSRSIVRVLDMKMMKTHNPAHLQPLELTDQMHESCLLIDGVFYRH
jgi:hypothetical protein